MPEIVPRKYAALIARMAPLAEEAEKTGDSSQVVSLADKILDHSDVAQYPIFRATVRLERAHALAIDSKGVTSEQARFIQTELGWIRDNIGSQLNPQIISLLGFIEGITCLVIGTDTANVETLTRARDLLWEAQRKPSAPFSTSLSQLLYVRAITLLLTARRALGSHSNSQSADLSRALAALIQRQSGSRYIASKRLAFAYHLTAAEASYELSQVDQIISQKAATIGGMTPLNQSFVMSIGAADQQPAVIGPPLAWPGEFVILFSEVIISAAVEAMKSAEASMRAELEVFIRRLIFAYDPPGLPGIAPLARTLGGLIFSHTSLQYAIFGPGRRLSDAELDVLNKTFNAAVEGAAAVPADSATASDLLLKGLKTALDTAARAAG